VPRLQQYAMNPIRPMIQSLPLLPAVPYHCVQVQYVTGCCSNDDTSWALLGSVRCSVFQCVVVCCSVLQLVAATTTGAVWCSVLQQRRQVICVSCCNVLTIMIAFVIRNRNLVPLIQGLCYSNPLKFEFSGFQVWCSVLQQRRSALSASWCSAVQCGAVCCGVLPFVAVTTSAMCCNVLQQRAQVMSVSYCCSTVSSKSIKDLIKRKNKRFIWTKRFFENSREK